MQGLNCAGTVRYCVPALLEKARDRTGTNSTAARLIYLTLALVTWP